MLGIFVLSIFSHLNCLHNISNLQKPWCSKIIRRKIGLWVVGNPACIRALLTTKGKKCLFPEPYRMGAIVFRSLYLIQRTQKSMTGLRPAFCLGTTFKAMVNNQADSKKEPPKLEYFC